MKHEAGGTQYSGQILIHASQGKAGNIFADDIPFKKYIPDLRKLPFGAIIGQATISDVIKVETLGMTDDLINRLTMEEKAFGDYSEVRYACSAGQLLYGPLLVRYGRKKPLYAGLFFPTVKHKRLSGTIHPI